VNKALDYGEGKNTFLRFQGAVNRFLDIKVHYLGPILEDRKLTQSVRNQRPLVIGYPNSDAAKDILNIAKYIMGEKNSEGGKGVQSLFKKIFNIFS